ncbi:PREDICTED: cysteine-rich repeat secretory protein 38-like [Nelumbo nucifera]|uniref:Cysteine-rich repeat secretory protein 38-like n=2 Tax=Nelumbo nucifera TaxID=4432 RepID=A0A1U7Z4A2_NELNU|nr:PREDICTED: cysteine-rich repeat secretory protein 38-like [Nelumbo nucifera]DAD20634.1 TPA_asm: hypothetical protein HUJ06_022097 [Nelumbo nucifera]
MYSLRFTPLCLLTISLLVHGVISADPLFHFCSKSGNFSAKSPYEINLNKLMSSLSYKVVPSGFGLGSVGQAPDRANGLALCRGDVSSTDCKTCVSEAKTEILQRCPNDKEGIIWYDNCLLKYSNKDFFGNIDYKYKFYMWNVQNVSNPASFNQKTKELLSHLTNEAYHSPKLFATGEQKLGEAQTLYGLVQCTRDLSTTGCKKCLDEAISEISSCCDGKIGGRVVGGSCNFRYELYPFVN